ncbi:transglutaminase domain-containing protein [bacterium]|nr:transglutaminase domain-containing protein [bacterium]
MKNQSFMLLVALLLFVSITGIFAQDEGEESFFYNIYLSGNRAGYHRYTISPEKSIFLVSGETYLKIKIMGQEEELSFKERTTLDPKYHPLNYDLTIETSTGIQMISVQFGKEGIFEVIESEGETIEKEFEMKEKGFLLDNNMLSHYNMILQRLNYDINESQSFFIMVPQAMQTFTLYMQVAGADEYEGHTCYSVEGNLEGIEMNMLVEKETHILKKISIPSQNFEAMLESEGTPPDETPIQSQEVLEPILEKLFVESNVDMGDFKLLEMLEADIEVAVQVSDGEIYLNNFNQAFTGAIDGNWVKGRVKVQPLTYRPTKHIEYPPYYPFEGDSRYLEPEAGIESGDPELVEKAQKIVGNSETLWGAIRRINIWVNRHIEYKITMGSAKDCYLSKEGDCGPKSLLLIAFLRAVGIPARLVGGLLYADGKFGQHNWVEVWVGEDPGWVPIDPTVGEDEKINAGHITLWQGMGTVAPSAGKMKVEVVDFD